MNARRICARGCGSFLVLSCLAAILLPAHLVRGQDAPPDIPLQTDWPEQDVADRLEQKMTTPASVDFVDTPLTDAIDFLAEQAQVPFIFDHRALTDAGVEIDTPIRLNVRDIRLESALNLMLEPLDLDWEYRDEAVLITSQAEAESLLSNRVYPVGDLLQRIGPHQISLLMDVVSAESPTVWDEVGGPASAHILGNLLVITAQRSVHTDISRLLAHLRRAYKLDAPPLEASATEQLALDALRNPFDVDFVDVSLADACAFLAEQSGAQILLDDQSLSDAGVAADEAVSQHAREITLRSALNRLLDPLDLTWEIRNEVLMVVSQADCESRMTMRLHRLDNLAGDPPQADRVRRLIVDSIAPTSWDEVGGPGSVHLLPGLLVVHQTQETQRQVEMLLERLRAGGPLPKEAESETQMLGKGQEGCQRRVYFISTVSPDDVASAIRATVAPETWQNGQGSIVVIRAEALPTPGSATDGGSSAEPASPGSPAVGVRADVRQRHASIGSAAPPPPSHRLVVVQRPEVHAQIQRFLRELSGLTYGFGGISGGGFFRLPLGR